MAVKQGKAGKVMEGAATIANIGEWSLSIDSQELEYTGLGATAPVFIGTGLAYVKGSVKYTAMDQADVGTAAIRAKILDNSTSIALKLYEDGTKYWGGDAIITGMPESSTVDGLVTGSFDFVGTGAWTYN